MVRKWSRRRGIGNQWVVSMIIMLIICLWTVSSLDRVMACCLFGTSPLYERILSIGTSEANCSEIWIINIFCFENYFQNVCKMSAFWSGLIKMVDSLQRRFHNAFVERNFCVNMILLVWSIGKSALVKVKGWCWTREHPSTELIMNRSIEADLHDETLRLNSSMPSDAQIRH